MVKHSLQEFNLQAYSMLTFNLIYKVTIRTASGGFGDVPCCIAPVARTMVKE